MRRAELFVKAGRGAEYSQGYGIRVDRQLGKPREKVKYGEDRAAAECVEHLIYAGNCNLWDLGDLIQILVVYGDSNAARLFLNAYQGT